MTEPMIVPEALAERLRAVAEARGRDPDELLTATLTAVIDYYQHDRDTGHGHWLLSILHTDDGPTPPTGLGKVLPSWPRWRIETLWPDENLGSLAPPRKARRLRPKPPRAQTRRSSSEMTPSFTKTGRPSIRNRRSVPSVWVTWTSRPLSRRSRTALPVRSSSP